ncbi:MAG: hypothetical protein WD468_07735, partial [Pirellulales bacterium]
MNRRREFWLRTLVAAIIGGLATTAVADVFPNPSIAQNNRSGSNRYNGLKRALFYVVHDDDVTFSTSEWNSIVASIRSKELATREFYAENSGGKFDIYYDPVIVNAPIPLNADNTRPSNWTTLANNIASGPSYNLNLSNYYMTAYDVSRTTADPGQGWGGLSTGTSIYLQQTNGWLINHEIGHQVNPGSNDHAKAIRQLEDSNFHPCYWDKTSLSYENYVPGVSPFTPVPFGAAHYEYGNPFDTMGNINTNATGGHFRIQVKRRDLNWLTSSQVPDLGSPSAGDVGTYKIYAHDELQSVTDANGNFGVVQGYNPNVFYGLSYTRQGRTFSTTSGNFVNQNQTIDLEYRSGKNGIAFYLNGSLIDMDPDGGESYSNHERLLEIGNQIEDVDFGMSNFLVDAGAIDSTPSGIDFLSFNPPPPTISAASWLHFLVGPTGSDPIGSYITVTISLANALSGIAGDLNRDGVLNSTDLNLFVTGWLSNTSTLSS